MLTFLMLTLVVLGLSASGSSPRNRGDAAPSPKSGRGKHMLTFLTLTLVVLGLDASGSSPRNRGDAAPSPKSGRAGEG